MRYLHVKQLMKNLGMDFQLVLESSGSNAIIRSILSIENNQL